MTDQEILDAINNASANVARQFAETLQAIDARIVALETAEPQAAPDKEELAILRYQTSELSMLTAGRPLDSMGEQGPQ